MALRDLVTFAQEHISRQELIADHRLGPPRLPHLERSAENGLHMERDNGPTGERPPYPDWLREPAGDVIRVDGLGNLEIDDEAITSVMVAEILGGGLPDLYKSTCADALAYYLPYHFYRDGVWGIYLRALGVAYWASAIKGELVGPGDSILVQAAEHVLFNHEAYHCQVEAAATRAEIVAGRAVYRPYFYDSRAIPHEEALANAQAYRRLARAFSSHAGPLRKWMSKQGIGYSDFHKYVNAREFSKGQQKCGRHILRHVSPSRLLPTQTPADFLFGRVSVKAIPTFVVVEKAIARYVLRPFPKHNGVVVKAHARDHPPPHIHIEMPPGTQITKYIWDEPLRPVPGQRELSSREEKRLANYLDRFGIAIHEDVCKKYPQHTMQMPAFLKQSGVLRTR